LLLGLLATSGAQCAQTARETIARAVSAEDPAEQQRLVASLAGQSDPDIARLLTSWKEGEFFLYEPVDAEGSPRGPKVPVTLGEDKDADEKQPALRLDTAQPLLDEKVAPVRLAAGDLTSADTDADLRLAMKDVLEAFALTDPLPARRLQAIQQVGFAQDAAKLPLLAARLDQEKDTAARKAIREAMAMVRLKAEDDSVKIAACAELGRLGSIPSRDLLNALARDFAETKPYVAAAANDAKGRIADHLWWVNTWGTVFRGFSGGSVLLIIAIGLAITFGLMGVINMAHGELIAVGAYTTYLLQCVFGAGLTLAPFGLFSFSLPALNLSGRAYDAYFAFALPLSFVAAALVGIALERGIIRFLYRRPLESLLATWGVSLVFQQIFRSVFGANNVQVDSPAWLSGNFTAFDVTFGWNRLFVIAFAGAIIAGTWLILNKTSLGLLIRAVMQNRQMAACMGVRTERVNMLTFGFGSGLAGLAGAFLSQIGNVGPGMGQDRIVDAFMTVVVGGVGNLFGTVLSALFIGVADQSLQQVLGNPVLGKILVLGGIILFLQWRPAGLFVTSSRSLEG